jgi:UDP-N-acetylmuramoyl-tripeptide--D-alanyl-D-alanine ligase
MDIDTIKSALEAYQPSNSRSQLLEKGTNTIILDAYNANPSSMKLALENMATLHTEKSKWLLLGAMKEMGESCYEEHKSLVDLAKHLNFEQVLLVGEEFESVKDQYQWFATSAEAYDWISRNPIANSVVLVKGSRGSKMEVVLEAL